MQCVELQCVFKDQWKTEDGAKRVAVVLYVRVVQDKYEDSETVVIRAVGMINGFEVGVVPIQF